MYLTIASSCFLSLASCFCVGGDEEDRTPDPLLAKQVLSQLSYTPMHFKVGVAQLASLHPHELGTQVFLCLFSRYQPTDYIGRSRLRYA